LIVVNDKFPEFRATFLLEEGTRYVPFISKEGAGEFELEVSRPS